MGLVSAAMSGVQAVAQYGAQQQAYDAQVEANNRAQASINQAARENYAALQLRREQEKAKAGSELEEVQREGLQARERAIVAAGEAGVSGLSVDALVRDFYGQELRYGTRLGTNYRMFSTQIDSDMNRVRQGAQRELNALPTPQKPSFLEPLMGIAGGLFGAYRQHARAPAGY